MKGEKFIMVLNINHSLIMEGANKRFKNESLYRIPAMEESYYLMGLRTITEMKEEMNQTMLEFYKLSEMDMDVISEADDSKNQNILKKVWDQIKKIFETLIKAVIHIKNVILAAIDAYIANRRRKKKQEQKKAEKEGREKIAEHYTEDMYFGVSMYRNDLSPELSNADWPSSDLIFNSNQIYSMIEVIDGMVKKNSWDTNAANTGLKMQYDTIENMRILLRKKLVPAAYVNNDYMNDAAYEKGLRTVITGNDTKLMRKVDMATALRSYENLKSYDNIIKEFEKVKSDVNKKYSSITTDLQKLMRETEDRVKNPMKYAMKNNINGPVSSQTYIESIARFAGSIYNVILGALNDHLLAYTIKMEILVEKENTDQFIIDRINGLIDQKLALNQQPSNESAPVIIDMDNEYYELCKEADETLNEFCRGCLLLRQEQSDYELHQYLYENVLMEADGQDKVGFSKRIEQLIEFVVNMFNRFKTSLDALITRDKKWIEQNEKIITNNNFQFPNQNEKIGEWVDYDVNEFTKSSNIPVFDMTNKELITALESEESFSKYIFTKMGKSESSISNEEAKNGSFSKKCEALFSSGGQQKEVLISQLQSKKNEMFTYCKGYMGGEEGSVYKNIVKESSVLDASKKNVLRTLKTHETNGQQQKTEQNKTNTQTQQTSSTSTNKGTPENQQNANTQNTQSSSTSAQTKTNEDFNFDLASILGICENSLLMELQMPQTEKVDRAAIDQNISAAGGDDKDTLKDLRNKANRFFTMYGNMLGAKMSCSMKCYKQYMQLFKWSLKASDNRSQTNSDNLNNDNTEQTADTEETIADKVKKK